MLTLKEIHFSYSGKKILNDLSFTVNKGEILALIGVSGSGKTTLFKIIMGLIFPEKGEIFQESEKSATYMQQEDLLLPWRTVWDNLLLFTELGAQNKRENYLEKAKYLLERLSLKGSASLLPNQLSGGMKQRLSLARALLQKRPLLLLDEPFGSLDLLIREELYQLLLEIREEEKKTLLLVTHDFRDAFSIADRILLLHQGTIQETFALERHKKDDPLYREEISSKIKKVLSSEALAPHYR